MQNKVLNATHRFLSADELECVYIRCELQRRELEVMKSQTIFLETLGQGDQLKDLLKKVAIAEMEIGIHEKVMDWHKQNQVVAPVQPLDHTQLLREDRAFSIYLSLIQGFAHQLSSHMVAPDELAALARDCESDFFNTEIPSDPTLLQFEGVQTVFGNFITNVDEVWFETHDGQQVMIANFSEQIWAIDAARELEERFNGYPVKVKDE